MCWLITSCALILFSAAKLQQLREASGVQIHGILIGEDRATPLDSLCDEVRPRL